jgi:hypothetical protein
LPRSQAELRGDRLDAELHAELAGLRGDGGFSAELGQGADITLDYWFE